jgi:hypothetical protein
MMSRFAARLAHRGTGIWPPALGFVGALQG